MLLGRAFAYSDTHRYRIGPNYLQLPVNRPRVDVNSYTFDGAMAYEHSGDAPVYAPNSAGRPYSDVTGPVEDGWYADGEMVRTAYELRADDDDWSQPGALVRAVMDDAQRERLVQTIAGHLLDGVQGDVLERAFQYWSNVDADTGKKVEEHVRAGANAAAADDARGVVREPRTQS
jgi:catalase